MIKQNILVVDDHRENLIALEAILEAPNRNLVMASSGNEALALALKHDFSLILLDVQMPEMDGFEVAELLRKSKRTSTIPIIFVTAISKEQKYVFRGYECGAVDYMFKPIDQQILEAKVNIFLDMDLQRRKLQQAVVQMKRLKDENERLLQALGEGVIGTDAEGRITFCNDAAATLLDTKRAQLVGRPVDSILFFDDKGNQRWPWAQSPLLEACRAGEPWRNQQVLYARCGNRSLAVELTANAINASGDKFTGAVVLLRDVTGREYLEAEHQARESRRHPRKKVFRETVLFDQSTGGNVGRLLNISVDGFKLLVRQPPEEGKRFALGMVLPEQTNGMNTLTFNAKLVWSETQDKKDEYHAGFQFVDMSENVRQTVEALLEKL